MQVNNHYSPSQALIPSPTKKASQNINGFNPYLIGGGVALTVGIGFSLAATIGIAIAVFHEFGLLVSEIVRDKFCKYDITAIEKELKTKFSPVIIDKLKNVKQLDSELLLRRLAVSHQAEQEIIKTLLTKFEISDEMLEEILMGAHIRLDDNGMQYKEWNKNIPKECKKSRISSHPSCDTQYGISGPLVKELLFSKIEEDGKVYTWFQLENHPVSFGHIIRHTLDYFKYKMTGRQQGPYGSSDATHHKPLILNQKKMPAKTFSSSEKGPG